MADGTRRRGAELERAILEAAMAELTEHGYPGLTMERVARRAGTNKNALYRRWPHRAALGIAAYRAHCADAGQAPDTGSLRGDALELLRRANSTWSSPTGALLRALLAGAQDDPELLEHLQQGSADAAGDPWLTLVGRAVDRGEAGPDALRPRVATVPVALLRNEYVTSGHPTVADEVLLEIIDQVFLPLVRP